MVVGLLHDNAFFSVADRNISLRLLGLLIMAIAAYLALVAPRTMGNQRRARSGQLALGLYVILAAIGAGVLAAVSALRASGWFQADGLSNPGVLPLLALTLLLGAMLSVVSVNALSRGWYSVAFIFGIPAWVVGLLDVLVLCAFWFSSTTPSGTIRNGALVMGALSLAVAVPALGALAARAVGDREVRGILGRASMIAVTAASQITLLLVTRAPGGWYEGKHLGGADLMVAGAAVGAIVFLIAYLAEGLYQPEVAEVSVPRTQREPVEVALALVEPLAIRPTTLEPAEHSLPRAA